MKTILLNYADITTKKVDTDYFNWTCPDCKNKNITNEWLCTDRVMICMNCKNLVKYDWNRTELAKKQQ